MQTGFDAFLSHNSSDKALVREIAQQLEEQHIKVWFDEWELQPGRPWQLELERAITESRAVVVFIGLQGLGKWERPELRAALDQQVQDSRPVIPVLLETIASLPGFGMAPEGPVS